MRTSGSKPPGSKGATTTPYWRTSSKPTTWGGYNTGGRNWSQPYRKNMPVVPQPVIVNYHGYDYRTYPNYPGYYPVGVWPVGYGAHYGCAADRESGPAPAGAQTQPPTTTVTTTVEPTMTPRGATTPSGTPPLGGATTPSGTPRLGDDRCPTYAPLTDAHARRVLAAGLTGQYPSPHREGSPRPD
ncbi:hypothetical protein F1D05_09970 [Kribbella qitaiheensis]|uniref:Uncharacterized protein n=1 Tax=Kribbella qitaiheensis TaxID=1544730 RepID=A0A7G6WVZ4_9ACTN|nr:hypothetical protein [Kribbella qitaiheensis]QNE18159.1 hypothetical protein F1D05_09970 [Kribbella qitaiheensis]